VLTDFVVTAPAGRNVYSFVEKKPSSSDRSDICRPDIAPLGLGKYFAFMTINISPRWGSRIVTTTKSVSTRKIYKLRQRWISPQNRDDLTHFHSDRDIKREQKIAMNSRIRAGKPWQLHLTACLDVVGPQCPDIANVKPPISNHRIRPRLLRHRPQAITLRLSWRSESALFAVAFRGRLYQRDISFLAVKIKKPIGVGSRPSTYPLALPFHLPCSDLTRDQPRARRAVKIVTNQYRS